MPRMSEPQVSGAMVLSCDHAKFLNHSDQANIDIQGDTTRANRDIKKTKKSLAITGFAALISQARFEQLQYAEPCIGRGHRQTLANGTAPPSITITELAQPP
jgi:hypothetical protein